jgi:hydroxyethylthiazole kinase-like sugar kinase family protein
MYIMLGCMLASFACMFMTSNSDDLMYCTIAFLLSGVCGTLAMVANSRKTT